MGYQHDCLCFCPPCAAEHNAKAQAGAGMSQSEKAWEDASPGDRWDTIRELLTGGWWAASQDTVSPYNDGFMLIHSKEGLSEQRLIDEAPQRLYFFAGKGQEGWLCEFRGDRGVAVDIRFDVDVDVERGALVFYPTGNMNY